MKHFLVIVVGCLPLGWLTASNVTKWRSPPDNSATAAENAKPDLAANEDRVNQAKKDLQIAKADTEIVHSLISLEPFTHSPPPVNAVTDARLVELAGIWQDYTKALDTAVEGHRIYRKNKTLDPKAEITALKAFRDFKLGNMRGVELIKEWCDTRVESLERTQALVIALDDIRARFAARQYPEVIAKLKEHRIEDLPAGALSAAEKSEMLRYLEKSRFLLYWRSAEDSSGGDAARIAKLKSLIKGDKESPLPKDDEDHAMIRKYEKEVADLERKLKIERLFDPKSQRGLVELVQECQEILDEDQGARPRLKNGLKKWISEQFVAKEVPMSQLKEAVVKKKNDYRRGLFVRDRQIKDTAYNFSDPENKIPNEFLYLSELDGEPQILLEIRVCRDYNTHLSLLMKEFDSKSRWEGFAAKCDEFQSQLADYYATLPARYSRLPTKAGAAHFQSEGQLAREVIGQWLSLQEILK